MPINGYRIDDPFDNHPLSSRPREQARLEETMDGDEPAVSVEPQRSYGPARSPSSTSRRSRQRRRAKRLLASGRSHATSTGATSLAPQLQLLPRA